VIFTGFCFLRACLLQAGLPIPPQRQIMMQIPEKYEIFERFRSELLL
jgi:hypothetical protein